MIISATEATSSNSESINNKICNSILEAMPALIKSSSS